MNLKDLLSKYIQKTDRAFGEITLAIETVDVSAEKAKSIVDLASRYLEDAKYFRDRKRFETGLASVAYSEGLLDALRLLGVVEFSW